MTKQTAQVIEAGAKRPTEAVEGLNDLVDRWLATKTNEATRRTYRTRINHFISFLGGRSIDEEALNDWNRHVSEQVDEEEGITANTARARLHATTSFVSWTWTMDYQDAISPRKVRELIDVPEGEGISPKDILTSEEMAKVISSAVPGREKTAAVMLAGSGLRASEAIQITPGDVYKKREGGETNYFIDVPKSAGKGDKARTVPVSPQVYEVISDYLTDQGREVSDGSDAVPILTGREGGITRMTLHRDLSNATDRAGIDRDISTHNFRHTYATQKIMQGVPLRVVSRRLGHAKLETTEKNYVWIADELKADTVTAWWEDSPDA